MSWNNGYERKKFEQEQKAQAKEYRKCGMNEEQIQAMYLQDLQEYRNNRVYAIRKRFLTRQNNRALEITFHHNNNGFITGKLFDLAFQRFKSCKFTSLFSPVTTDKLIPSVLF